MKRHRLAIVTSHPIQYQGPLFRMLHEHPRIEATALFCSDHGQRPTFDAEFATSFAWQTPFTEGYPHEYLPSLKPNAGPTGFFDLVNPRLWTELTPARFDAVMLVGWALASYWLALAAARAHRLPVLLRADTVSEAWHERPAWRELARKAVLTGFFHNVDAFLSVGSLTTATYRDFGVPEERIFLAPHAVDNAFFLAQADAARPRRAELRRALGVADDRPIVVVVGKLIERKAPFDALEAFRRVRRELAAKLVFVGEGPLRGALEQEIARHGLQDDVAITGFRQQHELGDSYGAADAMLFPTHYETWGLVVNEAMLFGLPVFCTERVPAHHDLILPDRTGDTYPAGDLDALTALLRRHLANPAKLHAMGVHALQHIKGWGFEQCVEATAAALERIRRAD